MNAQWGSNRRRVEDFLARIEAHNETLNALILTTPESARATADVADKAAAEGRSTGPLHGMVIALKDNINTAQIRTTSGSKLYEYYVPEHDAEVWRRLQAAGAILIGKAGMHECAFGTTSQNSWYGAIRNPWNPAHIPGGSSGGSGAAVAARFCDLALGTDTGGSVRLPAAMCGCAGLRPTQGAVSNRGVRPVSHLIDTVGPLAHCVTDIAKAYAVMQAYDPADETSQAAPAELDLSALDAGVQGLKIGIPEGFFYQQLHSDVENAVRQAAQQFAALGAELVSIELPEAAQASTATARQIVADAADLYRQEIEQTPELFSEQNLRRMQTGFEVSGIEYASIMRLMLRWRRRLENVFNEVDLVLTPTLRIPAPAIADTGDLIGITRDIAPFTMSWAMTGVPNLVLPCGFSSDGLPVSCQLAARHWHEALLFQAGIAYQSVTDFHTKTPPGF